ncbi:MAG: glycosyltransferase family 4 protein [Candidatus Bathyarchaeia archaeon]
MKIAVLAPFLIPAHPAGSQMLKVVQGLADEHKFTVFGAMIDRSLVNKVEFYKMPIPYRPILTSYLVQFPLYGFLFKRLRLSQSFDVVHAIEICSPFSSIITLHCCFNRVVELMRKGVIRHNGIRKPYRHLLYILSAKMENYVVKNPYLKRLITVSEGLKKDILYFSSPSVVPRVIPNGIDVERFMQARQYRNAMRRELNIGEKETVGVICALGDWERKGLGLLVEALTLLPRNSLKILVIGGGPIKYYQELARNMGVSDALIFTGFVRDVEKLYAAGDFFILPTVFEAWPLVVLEAAATGLPLLVTRVNGVEDFVEHGVNGFFIERNPYSIADTIGSIICDRDKLRIMGEEALKRVQMFDISRMVDAYRQLYEEIN